MLAIHLFSKREENFEHADFDREIAFYESICSGNIELVRLLASPLCSEGSGILSKDALQNMKYHFTVSAALIARFCIKSGMTVEDAYHLRKFMLSMRKCWTAIPEKCAISAMALSIPNKLSEQ